MMKEVYKALREHRYDAASERLLVVQATSMRMWYVEHFTEALRTLRAIYKETHAQQVLHVAEVVGEVAIKAFPKQSFIASQYGWVLYDRYVKAHDVTNEKKEAVAQRILHMTVQSTYSPFEATIWRLLPVYEERSLECAYALLQTLDRQTLSRDELRTTRAVETIVHPSSREKYYRKWIAYTWALDDMRTCYKACYEFLYRSGVRVRQPLVIYEKMIQALMRQGREEEAVAFAKTLAANEAYRSLLQYVP